MPRALLIANSYARGVTPSTVRAVVETLARGGWTAEAQVVGGPPEIGRLARSAAAGSAAAGSAATGSWDVLAVMGGDGTVIEAIAPLVGTDVRLAIIPAGTGNLLAGNLGVPSAPDAAARLIVRGRTRRIDVGEADWGGSARHFAVAAGVGFDARVMGSTHPTTKRRWGRVAYFATAVALARELRTVPHRLTIDGAVREIDASEVIVANFGELVPGLLRPRLPVVPDDGLLDVVVVAAAGPLQGLRGVWAALSHPAPGKDPSGRVFRTTATEVRVEAEPDQPVELDGDLRGRTPFTARILPRAISIVVPA